MTIFERYQTFIVNKENASLPGAIPNDVIYVPSGSEVNINYVEVWPDPVDRLGTEWVTIYILFPTQVLIEGKFYKEFIGTYMASLVEGLK